MRSFDQMPVVPLIAILLMISGLAKTQTVSSSNSSTDPCYNYVILEDTWRSTNSSNTTAHCDTSINWMGWYRLFYKGQSAKMPESCVSIYSCGTHAPLWLNGSHPGLEDGVVVRPVCGNFYGSCCIFQSPSIRVKACPGNYYVYEFVKPNFCYGAYCIDVSNITGQVNTSPTSQNTTRLFFPNVPGAVQYVVISDGNSTLIQLDRPFLYFGKQHSQLYLSRDGFLSFVYIFTDGFIYSTASLNKDMIAPLWTDIETDTRGNISYQQATSGPLIKLATEQITQMFRGIKFTATWVFVGTWEKGAFEPDTGEVTFQVVLISDDKKRSFVLMNYGDIAPASQAWMAGYKTEDNSHNFTIQAPNTSNLSATTNVGIPGTWAFRVDGAVSVSSTLFFPMLPDAIQNAVTVDGGNRLIQLDQPFVYFGKQHSQLYLSIDGFLSFENFTLDGYNPYLNKDIIAPLWTDIDSYTRGNLSYQQATSGSSVALATDEINRMFPELNFSASWVFVGTWAQMQFEPDTGEVTFQVVLISDTKNRSFVLMHYGDIPPPPQSWMTGYKTEDSTQNFYIEAPSTTNLSKTTNVGISGRWAFRVDALLSESPTLFYLFGLAAGDTVNPRSDDGSSSVIYLQSPFSFFGRSYSQLYVNNNGHLTFNQAWDSYAPTQFDIYSGRDMIAPFWTDLDNRGSGVISYNQYTNGNVLSQATNDINQYFPGVNFTASWVFVATWHKVAHYSYSGTETSFQVVLISDGNFSFVLMNYGDIAPANYRVEAGYDTNLTDYFTILWSVNKTTIQNLKYSSNVNVPGRWAFLVNRPKDAITKDDILAVRLKVKTTHNLTDTTYQKIFLQQFQDELRKRGVPSTVRVNIKRVEKTSP